MTTPPTRGQSTLESKESNPAQSGTKIEELTTASERSVETFREKARNNTIR